MIFVDVNKYSVGTGLVRLHQISRTLLRSGRLQAVEEKNVSKDQFIGPTITEKYLVFVINPFVVGQKPKTICWVGNIFNIIRNKKCSTRLLHLSKRREGGLRFVRLAIRGREGGGVVLEMGIFHR